MEGRGAGEDGRVNGGSEEEGIAMANLGRESGWKVRALCAMEQVSTHGRDRGRGNRDY